MLIKNAKQCRQSKEILSLKLIDIKEYTKMRPVKMDLFTVILFAFQFCLRLFLPAKNPNY